MGEFPSAASFWGRSTSLLSRCRGADAISWHGFSSRGRRRTNDHERVRRGRATSRREEPFSCSRRNASAAGVGVSPHHPSPVKTRPTSPVENPCHEKNAKLLRAGERERSDVPTGVSPEHFHSDFLAAIQQAQGGEINVATAMQ